MFRSHIAKRAGCSPETVRHYENRGLIDVPPRSASGYRLYGDKHLQQIHFIRAARELGFDLNAAKQLMRLSTQPDASCAAIDALTRSHLADIDARIERLQRLRRVLARMLGTCQSDRIADCGVIEALRETSAL